MKNYFLLAALTFSPFAMAEPTQPDIKEGLWELSFKSDIAAMGDPATSAAYSSQHCLNRQTAGDPHTLLQSNQCEISDLKQQATLVTWKMSCSQQGIQMTGDGVVNYQHESFNGTFNMAMQGQGAGVMKITTQTTGRYLGYCK